MVNKQEEEVQERDLDRLIEEFKRVKTIQDVGLFLRDFPTNRLPPNLIEVLSNWLKETSDSTIVQSHAGHPKTELMKFFPLIDAMREHGMSTHKASHLIAEKLETYAINPNTLRKRYNDHRSDLSRKMDALSASAAQLVEHGKIDYSKIEKEFGPIDMSVEKQVEQLVKMFGRKAVQTALIDLPEEKMNIRRKNESWDTIRPIGSLNSPAIWLHIKVVVSATTWSRPMDTSNAAIALLPLPKEDDTLIRRADLPRYLPVASQTWARWATEGQGPRFVKLGRRLVAYRAGDIRDWLQGQERRNTIEAA